MKRRFPTKTILLVVIVLGLGLASGSRWLGWQVVKVEIRRKFPTVPRLQTRELAAWLGDPQRLPPRLLDVREAAEFDVSHLATARLIEPGSDPATLGLPKDQPIVTYCSVGYRSAAYAQKLRQAGFTNVHNLEGSIFQWAEEGRPMVRNGQQEKVVHPYNSTWGLLLEPSLRADVPPADQGR